LLDHLLSKGADHIVVTGDITATGERKELERARSLFEEYGLLMPGKLSLVIGNHDVFGGVNTAEEILDFPSRLRETNYSRKVEEFRRHFSETFEGCLYGSREFGFPYAKIVGHVALIGMNSVAHYSRVKNPFGSNGAIRTGQRKRTERMLSSPSLQKLLKIVLIHHHFSRPKKIFEGTLQGVWRTIEQETLKLRKKKSLIKMFREQNVKMVLHGHLHESMDYLRDGIRFVNAGASVIGQNPRSLSAHLLFVNNNDVRLERIILSSSTSGNVGPTLRLIQEEAVDNAA
jgi:predicted phosphodiesterase